MKGIVVYQSFWGSCARIADAIAKGLLEAGTDVTAVPVEEAGAPGGDLDFVVIGGATRWPGARRKIRRYANSVVEAGMAGKPFATFSTGGTLSNENPTKQASEVLYDILEQGGLQPLAGPFSAAIDGYKPPGVHKGTLPESEVLRAEDLGRELGARLSAR
jgi:menaquinone-dependent protoporphyrinogen IX oxidase